METLIQDVKQALRMFRDHPAFSATAVIALMLGIGGNTAIFSVVNAVLLKPLPFPEPDRLVSVVHTMNGAPTQVYASPAHFAHWRGQTDVLEDVAAWRTVSLDYTAGDVPVSVTAGSVSAAYFRALRATFLEGRGFLAEEDRPGAGNTVVISHGFWTRRLAADPDVVGNTISLNGAAHTVIGITGRDFDVREIGVRGSGEPDVWVPLQLPPNTDTADFTVLLDVFARLKDGVPLELAQLRLAASMGEYRERFRDDSGDEWSFTVLPMQEALVRDARPMLLVLTGAVALVLLIACANVANLLLVRAASRDHEVAIRAALGAERWRIVRQLLTESLVLTLTGGALGLVAGFVGMRWLLSMGLIDLPRLAESAGGLGLDWRVASFALVLAIATGLVFGLVPALVSARTDLSAVMKDSSSRAASGRRQTKTQSLLVTIEVGLAVVLVIGAGLLIRTSFALGAVNLGFSVENVMTMRTLLSDPRFGSTAAVAQTSERVLQRLRSIPGVELAASSFGLPLQDHLFGPFDIIGRDNAGPSTGDAVAVPSSTSYFEAFEIPLLAGRRFDETDDAGAPAVALINQAMADVYWTDGSDPLRDRIRLGGALPDAADEPARQIIGIVGNVRQLGIMGEPGPALYFPHAQLSDRLNEAFNRPMAWIVRTHVDPLAVSAVVQQALREETRQPVTDIQLMKDTWLLSTSRQRLNSWLMSIFGGAALLLGAVGIYGLVAYSVQQRRHEIGIRMTVGAHPSTVRNMVIREGMLRVLIGVGVGLVAAYFLANVLASILFGVEPHDLAVFATVPIVLTAVALLAVSVPAFRASRVDPTVALRCS